MRFHFNASIAIYFLFTFLCVTLLTYATEKENTEIILNLGSVITPHLQEDYNFQLRGSTFKLLHLINKNIRCLILNQFLTIQDILILRKTCREFKILIFPNDTKMVMFGEDFCSKKMIQVPLIWFDLKYFLTQSYTNAFDEMEIFLLKRNQFDRKGNQYAVLAVLTHTKYKKIISWHNNKTPYPKIIWDKVSNGLKNKNKQSAFLPPKIWNQARNAWAIITNEGNVITGGYKSAGGDSSQVQFQLKNVKIIVCTDEAFSALLENGRVVAWGDENDGGKIPDEIQAQLKNVKMIFSTYGAFAALLNDGYVVAWGGQGEGGKIPYETQIQLKNVKMIYSTLGAFSALLHDGSVFTWGDGFSWGNGCVWENGEDGYKISHESQVQLIQNVKMIISTGDAFAALLHDGGVVAWGNKYLGGKIPSKTQAQLQNIKTIFSTGASFAALLHNGSVFAWGNENYGGKIPQTIQSRLHDGTKMIFSTLGAFAALLHDNSVVAWGAEDHGGKIPDIYIHLNFQTLQNVKMIFHTAGAFAALLHNGRVIAWGSENFGGKISHSIQSQLQNVTMIFSTDYAFAALLDDGSVFAWGDENFGGEISDHIQTKLMKNIKMIFPQRFGFTALCNNGKSIEWGDH